MSQPYALVCPLCPCALATSIRYKLSEYLKHIQLFHSHQPGFSLSCGIQGCQRTFKNFGTFKNHISSTHKHLFKSNCADPPPTSNSSSSSSSTSGECCGDTNGDLEDMYGYEDGGDQDCTTDPKSFQENRTDRLRTSAAMLLLKLKEKLKLTQVALQGVIEGVTGLFQEHLENLHSQVNNKLQEAGIPSIPGLDGLFHEDHVRRPFLGLETQHQQLSFYRTHFNFLEPVPVFLGEKRVWKGIGRKRRCVVQTDHVYYVPVLSTLQNLLKNKAVLTEITTQHTSVGSALEDYCDSKSFKTHPLFSTHPTALQIHFYFDELEVCNPLGSKAKIHKLGMFYFTLGNLRPKFRSRLSAVHLVCIVSHPNLSTYGIDAVIKPFVEDVKKLEKGYLFEVNGKMETVYGTLAVVSADNLGSLALGGFKESCSAFRCCRYCMATQDTARSVFLEREFTLRDKSSHIQHCALLKGENPVEASKTYGINRDSSLNELRYFHVCDGGLVPDVMHDVLEGALEYEVKLMLLEMITKNKFFSLDTLNTRLENLDYGYMEVKDRPTLIANTTLHSTSNKLKQQAAQMWLLGRILPLAVGDCVPEEDEHWANFLKLMEITDFLFSPSVTSEHASYVRSLIFEHHEDFKRLYPSRSIIPKMHFMVHMPRLMVEFGPLVRHWTMRYEAKHSYFKKLAQSMGNFINIPYTLSMRHQHLECYHNASTIVNSELEIGPGSVVDPALLEPHLQDKARSISVASAYE